MTIAKWMGEMPKPTATGMRIGPRMRRAGVRSMTIPTMSRKTAAMSRNTTGSSVIWLICTAMVWGTCSLAISQAEPVAAATISITTEDVTAASAAARYNLPSVSSR
jgi:hypothetical protein